MRAMNDGAERRQDDLRELTNAHNDVRFQHLREMAQLRAEHGREMALMESNRLNSIREVDALAVNTAASSAESLRAVIATTAAQLSVTVAAVTERVALLEKSSYMGVGRQTVNDPLIEQLFQEVRGLKTSGTMHTGQTQGVGMSVAVVVQIISSLASIGALIGLVSVLVRHGG